MQEKIAAIFGPWVEPLVSAALFAAIGISIAIGKILNSTERITTRLAVGRCITTGGLAVAAGSALALYPDLPLVAQLGVAAAIASLGTSGLEALAQRIFGGVGQ